MKKSLLALAILGAYVGVASAQSSVTLGGIVDTNGRYVKNDGARKRLSMATDGINSSRLYFRGTEDLGGGLRAGFWLEAGINPDIGTTNFATTPGNGLGGVNTVANNQSKFFNRRSTVSLISNAGELRLGRDYVPTFWNQTLFDAFGTNGLGASTNVALLVTHVRQDNTIGYFLPPNIGGFYGQAMVGAAEGGSSLDRPGRHIGGRIGFAAGPFDVAASYHKQRYAVGNNLNLGGETQDVWNVGGSFNFGFARLMGYFQHDELERGIDQKRFSISGIFPMGQSEIRVGYNRAKADLGATDATVDQIAATYQYNLSKRTAMYGTVSRLANKDNTTIALGGGNPIRVGGNSKGLELGVRHIF
jgi:predicted porin